MAITEISADERRLKQILVNLLSNAVKFTPERGRVALEISVNPENNLAYFTVSDNGIGIAPEDLRRLFKPFVQLDSGLSRQYDGSGLGLALVLKLAEAHGGHVHVESEVGKGSRFTVSLPWQPNVCEERTSLFDPNHLNYTSDIELGYPAEIIEAVIGSRGIILIADDNETNMLAISDYLQNRGYSLTFAHNGVEALVRVEETQPDLIFMDIQMPVMDGLEATRRLRQDPRFAATPIIALTALAMPGDRERCLEAGANDYLSKPVLLKELVNMVENMIPKRG